MKCACGVVLCRLCQFRFKECRLHVIRYQRLVENELTLSQISRLNVRNISYNLKSISTTAIIQMVKRQIHYAFSSQFLNANEPDWGENWQCGSVFTGTVGSVSFAAFEIFLVLFALSVSKQISSNLETHRLLGKKVLRNLPQNISSVEGSGQYRIPSERKPVSLSSQNYCYRFDSSTGALNSRVVLSHVRAEPYSR